MKILKAMSWINNFLLSNWRILNLNTHPKWLSQIWVVSWVAVSRLKIRISGDNMRELVIRLIHPCKLNLHLVFSNMRVMKHYSKNMLSLIYLKKTSYSPNNSVCDSLNWENVLVLANLAMYTCASIKPQDSCSHWKKYSNQPYYSTIWSSSSLNNWKSTTLCPTTILTSPNFTHIFMMSIIYFCLWST